MFTTALFCFFLDGECCGGRLVSGESLKTGSGVKFKFRRNAWLMSFARCIILMSKKNGPSVKSLLNLFHPVFSL